MMSMLLTVNGPSITQTLSNIRSINAAQAQIWTCQAFDTAHNVAETAVQAQSIQLRNYPICCPSDAHLMLFHTMSLCQVEGWDFSPGTYEQVLAIGLHMLLQACTTYYKLGVSFYQATKVYMCLNVQHLLPSSGSCLKCLHGLNS